MAYSDPNPLASIAYAACRGADMEPPMDSTALSSRAAYERLNRAAARAETLVLYRLDMLSGCRDSLDVDQVRLEASIQNLWRLTAVRKTLLSIEAVLNAPPKPAPASGKGLISLDPAIFEDESEDAANTQPEATAASASVSAVTDVDASGAQHVAALLDQAGRALAELEAEAALNEDQPAPSSEFLSPSPSPSCSQSEWASQSQSTPSTGTQELDGSHPSHPSHSSHNPQSAIRDPQSLLTIRSVPACPHMSLSSVARTLDRVNSDMANYTVHTSTAADYNFGNTAEEFFNPSPKSSPNSAPAAAIGDDDPDLLNDSALSPSLKNQISTRNFSPYRQVAQPPCPPVDSSSISHSSFRIPHSPRPPG